MLTSRAPFPVLNKAFRRANKRLSFFDPITIETALLHTSMNNALKADLDINITEKRTGHGVPKAPYSLYLNGTELTSGRCDNEGHGVEPLVLPTRKNEIDTYHGRRQLIKSSSHHTVLWDNFNDNDIDKKFWKSFRAPSMDTVKACERSGRIEFICGATRSLAGIHTVNPIDISNAHIKVRFNPVKYVVTFLTILPSTEPFYAASYNHGYDFGISEYLIRKLRVYSGTERVYKQSNLKANPETIEIALDGDTIKFLEAGSEVYSEAYKPRSKICNIYLWGHHWWHQGRGGSYGDDFLFVGG